jgi:hypothetical protein
MIERMSLTHRTAHSDFGSLVTIDQQTLDAQGNSIYYHHPPFTTYDAALDVGRETWLAQLYGENLTDTRGELYANYFQCCRRRARALKVEQPPRPSGRLVLPETRIITERFTETVGQLEARLGEDPERSRPALIEAIGDRIVLQPDMSGRFL